MVIDSEQTSNHDICTVLETFGYSTNRLPTPQQALSHLRTLPPGALKPHLIICDLLGDGLDGLDFLRDLRRYGFWSIPVMIVTSLESNSTFEKAVIDLGADDFVLKPVRTSELLLRVRLLLRGLPGVAAWRGPELL